MANSQDRKLQRPSGGLEEGPLDDEKELGEKHR